MARNERRSRRTYQEPSRTDNPILYVAKGSVVSIVVSLVFSFFLAVISLVTDLASIERYMPYIMLGATVCSVFIGSVYVTQQAQSKGLLIGIGVGVVYVLVAAMFDMQISADTFSAIAFGKKMSITVLTGAIGGIVGTNL